MLMSLRKNRACMITHVQPLIGVVTVTYNSATVIDGFMQSILAQTHLNFILYVVDNASSDATVAKVHSYQDRRVVVIANADNLGVATGNNQGITMSLDAGAMYVLLINNDTEFEPHLLEKLLTGIFEQSCTMVVPKIMYHSDPNIIWCAGGGFAKWRFYLPIHFGENEIDHGQYETPQHIFYAPTCCMLINRYVFEAVGLMDDKFFVYFDDVDFCFRAMRKGEKMAYLPNIQFAHKVSALTEGYKSTFGIRYHFRNRLYFLRKHFPFTIWITWLAWFQLHLLFDLLMGKSTIKDFVAKQQSLQTGLTLKITDIHLTSYVKN